MKKWLFGTILAVALASGVISTTLGNHHEGAKHAIVDNSMMFQPFYF